MTFKASLLCATMIASFGVSASVWASQPYHPANTQSGFVTHQVPSQKTRDQVMAELSAWQKNPVSSDGWRATPGEQGWTRDVQTPQMASESVQTSMSPAGSSSAHDLWVWVDGEAGWKFQPGF